MQRVAAGPLTAARRDLARTLSLGFSRSGGRGPWRSSPSSPLGCRGEVAMAVTHLLRGRPEHAAETLRAVLPESRERRCGLQDEAVVLTGLARTAPALGDPAGARAAAEEAVRVAGGQGARVPLCAAYLTLAQALRTAGTTVTPSACRRPADGTSHRTVWRPSG